MSSPIQPETPTENFDELDSCSLEQDYWAYQQDESSLDQEPVELSDALPTQAELDKAGSIQIYDADGTARTFKSLYTGSEHLGQRQLVIFVRHFYCGVS